MAGSLPVMFGSPDLHCCCGQVGEAAGKVHVPQFQPKQGVQIETDPKATSVGSAAALGDDEGVIDALIKRLQVGITVSNHGFCPLAGPPSFHMVWSQVWGLLY